MHAQKHYNLHTDPHAIVHSSTCTHTHSQAPSFSCTTLLILKRSGIGRGMGEEGIFISLILFASFLFWRTGALPGCYISNSHPLGHTSFPPTSLGMLYLKGIAGVCKYAFKAAVTHQMQAWRPFVLSLWVHPSRLGCRGEDSHNVRAWGLWFYLPSPEFRILVAVGRYRLYPWYSRPFKGAPDFHCPWDDLI